MSEREIEKWNQRPPATADGREGLISPPDGFGQYPAEDEPATHLSDYLAMVWRRRWLVLLAFLIALAASLYNVSRQDPLYKAVAKIEIKAEDQEPALSAAPASQAPKNPIETQIEILRGRELAKRVVEKLGLFSNVQEEPETEVTSSPAAAPTTSILASLWANLAKLLPGGKDQEVQGEPVDPAQAAMRARIDTFLFSLEVRPIAETNIVAVSFAAADPMLAASVVNTICDEYTSRTFLSKLARFGRAREWLEGELAKAKTVLEDSERKLRDFSRSNEVLLVADSSEELRKQVLEAERELDLAERRLSEQEFQLKRATSGTSPTLLSFDNTTVEQLRTERMALQRDLAEREVEWGPEDPQVKRIKARLKQVETQYAEELKGTKEKLKAVTANSQIEYEKAKSDHEFVKARYNKQRDTLIKTQELMTEFNILKRDIEVRKEIYNDFLQKRRAIDVDPVIQRSSVEVVERAEPPKAEIPSVTRSAVMGSFVGIFLGVGLVLFLNYMDRTVKSPEEVARVSHLPILGLIPHHKNGRGWLRRKRPVQLVAHADPMSPLAESFRCVRTAVLYSMPGRGPKTVLVTSALAGEGKTTVAVNLAIALAQKGKKVLVIDADLCRPAIHTLFKSTRNAGLTEILTGKLELNAGGEPGEAFRQTGVKNLVLLPSGTPVPNPLDLLDSDIMRDSLMLLSEEYDHIIIDTPPLTFRVDANVLVPYVDGVIYVVRPGKTPLNVVPWARDKIAAMQGRILGIVLNNPTQKPMNATAYGYGYAYAYGYGGHKEDRRRSHKEALQLAEAANAKPALPPPKHGSAT